MNKMPNRTMMNIKILFDKNAQGHELATGWGFSCLVDDAVLFDTGCDGRRLMKNIGIMGIRPSAVRAVVISHNHRDHRGGLKEFLKKRSGVQVWLGREGFEKSFFQKSISAGNIIHYPGKLSAVADRVYSTGEIEGKYLFRPMPEQSLVLKTSNGLTVITGCAHPGIDKILETIREGFKEKIHMVLGGFHLLGKRRKTIKEIISRFKKIGVCKVGPCHCTGKTAIHMFREAYGPSFVEIKVGDEFDI